MKENGIMGSPDSQGNADDSSEHKSAKSELSQQQNGTSTSTDKIVESTDGITDTNNSEQANNASLESGQESLQNGVYSPYQGLTRKQRLQEKRKNRQKRKKEQKLLQKFGEAVKLQQQNEANKQNKEKERRSKKSEKDGAKSDKEELGEIEFEYISAPIDHELDALKEAVQEAGNNDDDGDDQMMGLGLGGLGSRSAMLGAIQKHLQNKKQENSIDNAIDELKQVFSKFYTAEQLTGVVQDAEEDDEQEKKTQLQPVLEAQVKVEDDEEESDEDDEEGKSGKKKRKQQNRLKIAELKQICERPEVVEVWDVTANDPQTLVYIKAYRNTVPVPRHWSQKRKYLQGKRGIEKPGFKLPSFLEATGISEMRAAYHEKEQQKMTKQRQRERVRPKMGRLDIDYQILYDAFFKHQSKPNLSLLGDMYYEGKEYEVSHKHTRPSNLSEELKKALGMTDTSPPPWLINMQRYGPPPSYPNLKVPGLNAPIPKGASFGYHPGGWGKPPVDQDGNPLYGDVFGQYQNQTNSDGITAEQRRLRWGGLLSEEEEEEESEEEESEEEGEEEGDEAAQQAEKEKLAAQQNIPHLTDEALAEGIKSGIASGMLSGFQSGIASSLPSGLDTPSEVNLRKGVQSGTESERNLYTVLKEKKASVGQQIMGSDHVYEMPKDAADLARRGDAKSIKQSQVEVSLNPEQLEILDQNTIKELYEQQLKDNQEKGGRAEMFDMVQSHIAGTKRKAVQQKEQQGKNKQQKEEKFKF